LPFLCVAHTKAPPVELVAVEPLDSLRGSGLLGELNETKPPRTTGDTVIGQNNL
jgi:hypothetical protein